MENKYLVLVDEQNQDTTLQKLKDSLHEDGFNLVFEQINPQMPEFQERKDGDVTISIDKVMQKISNIPFFRYADTIACDYNLVPDINGFDIICKIRELNYKLNKKIILYSAGIEAVISEIIFQKDEVEFKKDQLKKLFTTNKKLIKEKIDSDIDGIVKDLNITVDNNFEDQVNKLQKITTSNILFVKRDDYFKEVLTNINKEKEFNFENELTEWFHKRNEDTFNYLFPKYIGKTFGEIAIELESKSSNSIQFKKDLIEQIIAYLVTINKLENA